MVASILNNKKSKIMKITFTLILYTTLSIALSGQVVLTPNSYRTKFESSFAPLLTRTIPHGVLYDRVIP